MRTNTIACATAGLLLSLLFSQVEAHAQRAQFASKQLLVKFKGDMQAARIQSTFIAAGLVQVDYIAALDLYQCNIVNQNSVPAAVQTCQQDPAVEYAEPNYIYSLDVVPAPRLTPNDPKFKNLWGLRNKNDADIDAEEAWDTQTGSKNVIVAIIDTGVDYRHGDLQANMWHNPGETGDGKENNGVDDDGNGYVDDWRGWNFQRNTSDPLDAHGHGTHVAGTVGAVGDNGKGVVGVNWNVTIMPLRFIGADGFGEGADAIKAIIYAADNGARIMSNSWGGDPFSRAMEEAIEYARDRNVIFVAAAGNDDLDNDKYPHYPSNYQVENVIAVAASDAGDDLADFTNFGRRRVHLAAPGVNILSTFGRSGYRYLDGTSMATPHVSGVAALILAQYPQLSYRQVMIRLLGGVDPIGKFRNFTITGGRLNAAKALSTEPHLAFVTSWEDTLFTEGPYLVDAEAVDEGRIAGMRLSYTIDGGDLQVEAMQPTGADRYRAGIPGQPRDAQISYFVEATDDAGNRRRSRVFAFKIAEKGGRGCGCSSANLASSSGADDSGLAALAYVGVLVGLVWGIGRRKR